MLSRWSLVTEIAIEISATWHANCFDFHVSSARRSFINAALRASPAVVFSWCRRLRPTFEPTDRDVAYVASRQLFKFQRFPPRRWKRANIDEKYQAFSGCVYHRVASRRDVSSVSLGMRGPARLAGVDLEAHTKASSRPMKEVPRDDASEISTRGHVPPARPISLLSGDSRGTRVARCGGTATAYAHCTRSDNEMYADTGMSSWERSRMRFDSIATRWTCYIGCRPYRPPRVAPAVLHSVGAA